MEGDGARPNILVCGTPGTGKTTTAECVAQQAGYTHINVGKLVAEKGLHSGWDEEHACWTLDEDKVCDALEDVLAEGGCIVEHHGCEFFPERCVELVQQEGGGRRETGSRRSRRGARTRSRRQQQASGQHTAAGRMRTYCTQAGARARAHPQPVVCVRTYTHTHSTTHSTQIAHPKHARTCTLTRTHAPGGLTWCWCCKRTTRCCMTG